MRHAAFRGGASSGGRAPAAGWLGSSHTGLRAAVHRRPPGRRSLCALFLLPARRGGLSPTGSSAGRQLTGGPAPPAGPARPPAPPAGAPSIRHFTKPWLGHECRSGSGDCSGTENEPPITNEPKENKTGPPRTCLHSRPRLPGSRSCHAEAAGPSTQERWRPVPRPVLYTRRAGVSVSPHPEKRGQPPHPGSHPKGTAHTPTALASPPAGAPT